MTATNINSNVCLFIIFTFLVGPVLFPKTWQLAHGDCDQVSFILFCKYKHHPSDEAPKKKPERV